MSFIGGCSGVPGMQSKNAEGVENCGQFWRLLREPGRGTHDTTEDRGHIEPREIPLCSSVPSVVKPSSLLYHSKSKMFSTEKSKQLYERTLGVLIEASSSSSRGPRK